MDDATIRAIERLINSGRSLILVTGRELPDLQSAFPRLDLCRRVVAENGALLYNPATGEKRILAERRPQTLLDNLLGRGVPGVSAGEVIISAGRSHETHIIEAIRESGVDLQLIFNKESVMILPPGINKMTGLDAALDDLKLSSSNLVGVGDAENDHVFMERCRYSVAVANAIPGLKEMADFVTQGNRGAGVVELIDKLIEGDLSCMQIRPHRIQ